MNILPKFVLFVPFVVNGPSQSSQPAPGVRQKAAVFESADIGRVVQLGDIDLGDFGVDARDDALDDFPSRDIRQ